MKHRIVYYDPGHWAAVPANNGMNGPAWQWGDELLAGFTVGSYRKAPTGHQCNYDLPFESWLARSSDGGRSWLTWKPAGYAGTLNTAASSAPCGAIDFTARGFVMRVEGTGYHGNRDPRWFFSRDRGDSWSGPYHFGDLLSHPALAGKQFTARTAYLVRGPRELLLFLSVRQPRGDDHLAVVLGEKSFVAQTTDGGAHFSFLSWVVPWNDPFRAAMPAPAWTAGQSIVTALRRKSLEHNWIDCFVSHDRGQSWSFLSKVVDTENDNQFNGNPPALLSMQDGRLCCLYGNRSTRSIVAHFSGDGGRSWSDPHVLRSEEEFKSTNDWPDLGYPRLYQRRDGTLVAVYFWCTPERPQTHIECTTFRPPER